MCAIHAYALGMLFRHPPVTASSINGKKVEKQEGFCLLKREPISFTSLSDRHIRPIAATAHHNHGSCF